MKFPLIVAVSLAVTITSCSRIKNQLVNKDFIDSLILNYQDPAFARANDSSLIFWEKRINPGLPGIVSEMKYAAALTMRFHQFGDIRDIETADSTIRKLDADFNHQEAPAQLFLMRNAILQHQFAESKKWLEKAKGNGLKEYDLLTSTFDVDFELGEIFSAASALKELKADGYSYYFRRSKMDHLNGLLDSSIHAMEKAAILEVGSPYLEQIALSNVADLMIHAGLLENAADRFTKCIRMNGADFHSLSGLGWIALVGDHNDSLAEKIFSFISEKNKLPDALYRLCLVAESRGDSTMERKYAEAFVIKATDKAYGNMYNKYLIELYTGILKNPVKAVDLARKELENRSTPQTHAWFAWALFSNNKKKDALDQFQRNISGMPLEGLELYWMGKLMKGLNKEYNANAFFEAAYANKYDLAPGIQHDLEIRLQK
jgi:hypothetical protein